MNGHDEIQPLLALQAAGALTDSERRTVEQHCAACEECARELRGWLELSSALGRMPTPLAPAALVERTRRLVEQEAEARRERSSETGALVFVTVLAWALTLSLWGALDALGYPIRAAWWLAWLAFSTLASGAAAAVLAIRRRIGGAYEHS